MKANQVMIIPDLRQLIEDMSRIRVRIKNPAEIIKIDFFVLGSKYKMDSNCIKATKTTVVMRVPHKACVETC